MDTLQAVPHGTPTKTALDFDAVVIGAGVSGLYQLYKIELVPLAIVLALARGVQPIQFAVIFRGKLLHGVRKP
jgi:hypothetical protein